MEELLAKVPVYVQAASVVLSGLVVVASAVAKVTPSKTDDEVVSKVGKFLFKVLAFLPKVGLNPQTKKLEEFYNEHKPHKGEIKK